MSKQRKGGKKKKDREPTTILRKTVRIKKKALQNVISKKTTSYISQMIFSREEKKN